MLATIAIVGRPNVGKSTLFNRMAGKRLALVDDTPGLTRDRKEGEALIGEYMVQLIDTAGLEQAGSKTLEARMRTQTEAAIGDADLVLFVIDARTGITPADEVFADLVRSSGKPVVVVANKCEGRKGEEGVFEAYNLGLGDPVAISAEHAIGLADLYHEIEARLLSLNRSQQEDSEYPEEDGEDGKRPLRVAIVGRPNAGKSTLVNALIGEERMITGPEAGITRDAIAVDFEWRERPVKLYDTAGLRRKSRIRDRLEKLSVGDALKAVQFAETVIILMDVQQPLEKQDLQIADLVAKEGRALVLAINKWDLIQDKQERMRELRREVERLLPQVKGVPVISISAQSGRGIDKLMDAVLEVDETWNKRVSTSDLNQFLSDAVDRHTPPAVAGRRLKLRYITQPHARPPTFIVFCSRPKDLPAAYQRYLVNGLREVFDLPGVPIRLHLRKGKNPYA